MKKRRLRSLMLLLLSAALLLSLLPASAAEEAFTSIEVPYYILFTDKTGTVTLYENAAGEYYITLETAEQLSGLTQTESGWAGANGYVLLTPELYDLPNETVEVFSIFPLAELMNCLQTTVFANADGALCVVPAAANLDALWAETDSVMQNGGYSADFLENTGFWDDAIRVFATGLDIAWNFRYDALWGEPERERLQEMLLTILQPQGSEENLLEQISGKAGTVDKVITTVLGAQEYVYDDFWKGLGEVVPGEGYLLFGKDGTGPLRELMEGAKALDENASLSVRDYLDIGAQLFAVEQISSYYADCLKTLFDQVDSSGGTEWLAFIEDPVYQNGQTVLDSYARYQEEEWSYLVHDAVKLTMQEYLNSYAKDTVSEALLSMDPVSKVLKSSLELLDKVTLKVGKKNSAVLTSMAAAKVQDSLGKMYDLAEQNGDFLPDTRAGILQSAATLYLRCAWEAYDALGFDSELAGAVERVQEQLTDALNGLLAFTPAMFYYEGNQPLQPGTLRSAAEKATPEGERDLYYEQYRAYVASLKWVSRTGYAFEEITEGGGEYYFCDIDLDGIDELLIKADRSHADGICLAFFGGDNGVTYLGGFQCGGLTTLESCGEEPGVLNVSVYQGVAMYERAGLVDGSFQSLGIVEEADLPKNRQQLEVNYVADLLESEQQVYAYNCEIFTMPEMDASEADFAVDGTGVMMSDYGDYERYVYALQDSAAGRSTTFSVPIEASQAEWTYDASYVQVLTANERYLVMSITAGPGEFYTLSYDAQENAFTQLPSDHFTVCGSCLIGSPEVFDVGAVWEQPYNLTAWGYDGTKICDLAVQKYGITYTCLEDGVYYSFAETTPFYNDAEGTYEDVLQQIWYFDLSSCTAHQVGTVMAAQIMEIGADSVVSYGFGSDWDTVRTIPY